MIALAAALAACSRPAGVPEVPALVVGHCVYTNNFSRREECREYLGDGWTTQAATDDCRGRGASVVLGSACGYPESLGYCILNANQRDVVRIRFPGNNAEQCGGSRTGCEFFGGGVFVPEGVCGTASGDASAPPTGGLPVFPQPELVCRQPVAGQDAGAGPDGSVCTWSAISACTEPGRRFEDYASCDAVRAQRPYYPVPRAPERTTPDPRMQDPAYVAELAWVRSQVESCGCVCCHSSRLAPRGPSNWFVEAEGNWMDSFGAAGLALGAGWIDSTALGAYPPEQNNGFARPTESGMPSTDPVRMARFFIRELENRGLSRETFRSARPFGGPIYDQLVYQPTACAGDEGVRADGTMRWTGGAARYVYVLEEGTSNPGVPPNLDLPTGTIWRLDVPADGTPVASGIRYGMAPPNTRQRFPVDAAPAPLTNGRRYYLYVLQDVGIPITRCLFTYPR